MATQIARKVQKLLALTGAVTDTQYARVSCFRLMLLTVLTRLVVPVATLLMASAAIAEWLVQSEPIMGTEVRVELWAEDATAGRALQAQVLSEFRRLDNMMNPWNPESLLSRINREAATAPVAVTPEISAVVQRALYYSELSNGAFDISFAAAGQHYDYRKNTLPSDDTLELARRAIDYRQIRLDADAATIGFEAPGMAIDLGGIAKGYAVDRAAEILLTAGVNSAVISAGGDSRLIGDRGGRPRTIGIRHPRKAGEYVAIIPLADTAISTSGDYERFFERDGQRHHHILDPTTGRSVSGIQSVSVITDRAMDSDALSTTVFVLGLESGLALVNTLPGVDAIIIDGDGKLHFSAELLLSTTE